MGQKDILELIAEHCQIRMRSNSFQLFGKNFHLLKFVAKKRNWCENMVHV